MITITINSALGIGLSLLLSSGIYLILLIISGELMPERQQFLAVVSRYRLNKIARKQAP